MAYDCIKVESFTLFQFLTIFGGHFSLTTVWSSIKTVLISSEKTRGERKQIEHSNVLLFQFLEEKKLERLRLRWDYSEEGEEEATYQVNSLLRWDDWERLRLSSFIFAPLELLCILIKPLEAKELGLCNLIYLFIYKYIFWGFHISIV